MRINKKHVENQKKKGSARPIEKLDLCVCQQNSKRQSQSGNEFKTTRFISSVTDLHTYLILFNTMSLLASQHHMGYYIISLMKIKMISD